MLSDKYDVLKLENQICFPLYAAAKEVVRKYTPYLEAIDLTYTQYITMMVMWEKREISVKELGEYLYLDSGTLTPVLKKLEQKGLIERNRDKNDERVLKASITKQGEALREKAVEIPYQMSRCVTMTQEDALQLQRILNKFLKNQ